MSGWTGVSQKGNITPGPVRGGARDSEPLAVRSGSGWQRLVPNKMLVRCFYMLVSSTPDIEEFKRTTLAKLVDIRCPRHGQGPRVDFEGADLRDVRISIRACCRHLSDLANLAIALKPPACPTVRT